MLEKEKILFFDELKKSFKDKRILAALFTYIMLLSIGMKYGATIGAFAKLLFIQSSMNVEIVLIYYAATALSPLLAILLSFDSVAGETATNSISHIVVRARRTSIIAAKYLSTATIILAINAIVYASAAAYFGIKTGNSMTHDAVTSCAYTTLYALAFLSISFVCTTSARKQQTALWAAISASALLLLLTAKDIFAAASPFTYATSIINGNAASGSLALAAFAAAGLLLSAMIFRRKDI
jgi:ABC-type transport system involved in multi-copper enzyme maturation permease subunit